MKSRIVLALALVATVPAATAFELLSHYFVEQTLQFQLGDVCDSARFPDTPGTCAGDAANPDWRTEFVTAASRWNAATDFFSITTDPGVGQSTPGTCNNNDPNSVFFLSDICGTAFGGTALAVARTTAIGNGEGAHTDIIFNTAYDWDAYDDSFQNHPNVFDFRRVAVHEIGHTMGLGHSFNTTPIMYFQSGDTIGPQIDDLAGLKSRYGIMEFAATLDVSGNAEQEIITVRSGDNQTITAELREGFSGALLKTIPFLSSAFTPVDAVVLPDLDGNGHLELAILAVRNSDDRALVEIRNITGAALPRIVWFSANAKPLKMISVPDADGNGVTELAVLMYRRSDMSRTYVEIKNAFGPTNPNVLWSSRSNFAFDLAVVDDADNNGVPEIAVLLSRWADARVMVEIRNASGPTAPNTVWAISGTTPIGLTTVADADSNGVPEVAILTERNSDGRIIVEVKNASGATAPNVLWFAAGHSPRAIATVDDADGNGVPEVAVLSRRDSDGRIVVESKNAAGATQPKALWYSSGYSPMPMLTILDDIDGNAVPEAAVMLFRTSDGRVTIQQRNLSGSTIARNIWFSL